MKTAEDANVKKILRINVWLGALSKVTAMDFHTQFLHAAEGSIAADTKLVIEQSYDLRHLDAREIIIKEIQGIVSI